MKIKIIPEKCIACGLCHLYAPEVFDYNDAGFVHLYQNIVSQENKLITKGFDENLDKLMKSVKFCPSGALVKLK